jgi:hypothetical protein
LTSLPESWNVRNWLFMPTSCVDDIFCSFSTIEQAVDAVLAYFFGEPTIIGEWSCPLHRHPELSIDGVHQALTNALVVTPTEFAVIECERKARFAAEVAARTPPLYLQWDEERRIEWAADPQSAEIETSIAASRKAVGLKPIGDPLPPWIAIRSRRRVLSLPRVLDGEPIPLHGTYPRIDQDTQGSAGHAGSRYSVLHVI